MQLRTTYSLRYVAGSMCLASAILCFAPGCSSAPVKNVQQTIPAQKLLGKVISSGFASGSAEWDLKESRYMESSLLDQTLEVKNSTLATGISPVWFLGQSPRDFDLVVGAETLNEGLDGGWGIEFGAKDRRYAYRALVYASGRFCVDRLFDTYPEFIHCVPHQPEVVAGESYNELRVRVAGYRVRIWLNGNEVLAFEDDRYQAGSLALATAGPNTRVVFRKWELAAGR